MAKARSKATVWQLKLFGKADRVEPEPKPDAGVMPLEWNGNRVRVVTIDGDPWFVLSDIAKVLGYRDAANASRILRDKHKGTHAVSTLGGGQTMTIVSFGGFCRLALKSRSQIADDFQDWVTDEVLPAIRKYGFYETPNRKYARLRRQTRGTLADAKVRGKNEEANKQSLAKSIKAGGGVTAFVDCANEAYDVLVPGETAKSLLAKLGMAGRHRSPQDRMDAASCLATVGGAAFAVVDGPARGMIVGVVKAVGSGGDDAAQPHSSAHARAAASNRSA